MRIIGNEARGKHVGWRFRLRQYLVGLLLLLVAAIPLGTSVPDLLEANEILGVRHPIGGGKSLSYFSDGSVATIRYEERDNYVYKSYNMDGRMLSKFDEGEVLTLMYIEYGNPLWADDNVMYWAGGLIDLRKGEVTWIKPPENFTEKAYYQGRLLGLYNGGPYWYDIESGNLDRVLVPEGSLFTVGHMKEKELYNSIEVKAVHEGDIFLEIQRDNKTFLELWPSNGGALQHYGPIAHVSLGSSFIHSRPDFAFMGNKVLFLDMQNGTNTLTSLDMGNLTLAWIVDVGELQNGYLFANEHRWVIGRRESEFIAEVQLFHHSFMFGNSAGEVEGKHRLGATTRWDGGLVYPVDKDLLYWENGRVWIAQPGSGPMAQDIAWATVGGLLVVAGLAWPVAAPPLLNRVAAGGKRRCLNCGSKRPSGMDFCSMCGWRTEDEDTAANLKKEVWEHEW